MEPLRDEAPAVPGVPDEVASTDASAGAGLRSPKKSPWPAVCAGILLIVIALIVVLVVVGSKHSAAGGGPPPPQPLQCEIVHCADVHVDAGATSCSGAVCQACDFGWSPASDDQGSFCAISCPVAHCDVPHPQARNETSCPSNVTCDRCTKGYEAEVNRSTLLPTGQCTFTCTAEQLQSGCASGSCNPAGCSQCVPGFSKVAAKGNLKGRRSQHGTGCEKASATTKMTFYMYRAQSAESYPPENCDLASAAGVMWFLHNEVVHFCPRHHNITRVLRYKVTVFNSPSTFGPRQGQFGPFVAFNYGMCTVGNCTDHWQQFGYAVGCQAQGMDRHYANSYWYSLPGKCPSRRWDNKTAECEASEPGGQCKTPDGSENCTWHAAPAGEVTIDELSGIADYDAFCAAGGVEYDSGTDQGRDCSFWDGKDDDAKNAARVLKLQQLFAKHYPVDDAMLLPDPLCDGF